MRLNRTERVEAIRRLMAVEGGARVGELCRRFSVSEMTVRRDLAKLEGQGQLTRTHGGGVSHSALVRELPFSEKNRLRAEEKAAIARELVRLLPDRVSVYLDTGTTLCYVARAMDAGKGVRVCTNNLRVALELFGREGMETFMFGGMLAARNPDLVGASAVEQVANYHFDVAVLGGDALDPETGELFAADVPSAGLSRAAARRAGKVMVALDSSKIGSRSLCVISRLERGMVLVTDSGLARRSFTKLKQHGIDVVVAAPGG